MSARDEMPHAYDEVVEVLRKAISLLDGLGLGESLAKGRVGEILLAHYLQHDLVLGDKGADGKAKDGKKYEYKVSTDGSDQYNFNFGDAPDGRKPKDGKAAAMVTKHFGGYEGAYCALVKQGRVIKLVYCPASNLVSVLSSHVEGIKKAAIQKNFSRIETFAVLPGASWVHSGSFNVPRQSDLSLGCIPACALAMLARLGITGSMDEQGLVASIWKDQTAGSGFERLKIALASVVLVEVERPKRSDFGKRLKTVAAAGDFPLVALRGDGNAAHCVVVESLLSDTVTFHDPATGSAHTESKKSFLARTAGDFAVLKLKPRPASTI